ncbi:FtsX-like permease family protein [Kitasatospora sp. NPDC096147]|uniref:FtsX-like permease family protein n=1 Tax=Kitasatospora sp. NPDC096147 TaxID=3364093 RepID=UPI0038228503
MTGIAIRSLRARWVSLLGAFTALALGVALMAVMVLGLAATAELPWSEAAVGLYAGFGTAGGVSTFVAGFVIASTFAYVVAQRKRELGLLRLAGAARGQVRRVVLAEALLLGVVGSAAGVGLGVAGAPWLGRELVRLQVAPEGFALVVTAWPLWAAFGTGLLVAVAGVAAAAYRAGRLGPLDALREADLDVGVMTVGRWLWGLGLLATAVVLVGTALVTEPGSLLRRKNYTVQPMALISACGLLAPVLVRPLLAGLGALPARLTAYAGRLARANALGAVRRSGAVAAPVLVAVALTGSLVGALGTVSAGRAAEAAARTVADVVVLPARGSDGPGLVAALRALPGVVASPSTAGAVSVVEPDGVAARTEAWAVEPAAYRDVARPPFTRGGLAALDDGSALLPEEWEAGERVLLELADGTRRSLRVAGVLRDGTGNGGVYVTAANLPGGRLDRVELKLAAGADPERVADVARRHGARAVSGAEWLAGEYPTRPDRTAWLRTRLVLGLAVVYTVIGLANVLVLATADRRRELGRLRLAGATRGQVVRLVSAEALLTVAAGVVLGLGVAGVNLGGMQLALRLLGVAAPLVVPWGVVGGVASVCGAVAVAVAAGAAAWAVRGRAVDAVG